MNTPLLSAFVAMLACSPALRAHTVATGENPPADSAAVELPEAVVRGALVRHDARSDLYVVTPELRRGATSVFDVLSRLPGVDYNALSGEVSVRMSRSVVIEIDGVEASADELQALPPERLSKIELIYAPPARYAASGTRYVIAVKRKSDYVGHELYAGNFAMLSAGDNNGRHPLANEQPSARYVYSGEKFDLSAGYAFADIHWNYPLSLNRTYNGAASIASALVSEKQPNDLNATTAHTARLGLDWHISPKQTLSFRTSFLSNDICRRTISDLSEFDPAGNATAHAANLTCQSALEWWIAPIKLTARADYARGMKKVPQLQGFSHYEQDLWQISLKRTFLADRLSVSLNHVPPIHAGVRTVQTSAIHTPSCASQTA